MYKKIDKCRICGNSDLRDIVDLGKQKLTGVFPVKGEFVNEAPLVLCKCTGKDNNACGLVQLRHSCNAQEMYGDNYGYRSGLNASMVNHLKGITDEIKRIVSLEEDDLVIDIGSNDSTLLQSYEIDGVDYVGMDPSGGKFAKYYPEYIELVPDFFSATNLKNIRGNKKAKVVTSIAMFYDLENPVKFAQDVADVLENDGIWILEQSYLPSMLKTNSYDTICQEHLEFYCLRQIEWIVDSVGLKVINVSKNAANGGSFRITVAKMDSKYLVNNNVLEMRMYEQENLFDELETYADFVKQIENSKIALKEFLKQVKTEGKVVLGYGASTKGNVLLQYCGITMGDIRAIAEVNEDKFGHVTPGTEIPIIDENEAKRLKPDYFLVLPWHFRDNILEKEEKYRRENNVKFVFPLPRLEIY